ncbi:MAG: hypothetical protein MJD61_13275 [Proteobacteria bacterium]|nr:hypothetical protein [Pseudomonadota bacterium]
MGGTVYPEAVILDNGVVPMLAYLEVPGSKTVSQRVPVELPEFLGGQPGPTKQRLQRFERTDEVRGGLPVFRRVKRAR